ncbi:Eukaryotic peptide chain release factor GTP-binding subunit [Phytophthora cinnamomi]|uniref:Eukaryotic peptide chain release factor GTP-binding subunit n=1 Tax=Phytophthora cinnamomi TaxID=4785 RepID=UPI00355A275A|nr:Eukaryotic peptide chain release factor GTP-binding subunit [Phytophthora cinnamomi]
MGRWLKIGHKRAIIRMAEAYPAMTQSELAAWVRKKFKLHAKPARNICLSRELVTMKARELQAHLCDAWDLNFSDGWLTAFMRRHKLRHRVLHGEAASVDPEVVRKGLQDIQQVTDLYAPHDIFNMDETGLGYAMGPTRSICTKKMRGVKKKKTRITLAMTANADGTDALPILYICVQQTATSYCF